mmetsp:Transcript_86657/g.176324  ORF Transcript_86657/g.176324 Transcript_86657/m.176324 type:complete len:224 (-) Transcript_86657:48-719(-)
MASSSFGMASWTLFLATSMRLLPATASSGLRTIAQWRLYFCITFAPIVLFSSPMPPPPPEAPLLWGWLSRGPSRRSPRSVSKVEARSNCPMARWVPHFLRRCRAARCGSTIDSGPTPPTPPEDAPFPAPEKTPSSSCPDSRSFWSYRLKRSSAAATAARASCSLASLACFAPLLFPFSVFCWLLAWCLPLAAPTRPRSRWKYSLSRYFLQNCSSLSSSGTFSS